MVESRRRQGCIAELLVWGWLAARGWSAIGHRLRIAGVEVDLVMRRRHVIALVEVKSRFRAGPSTAPLVTLGQRRRLARAARSVAGRRAGHLVRIDLAEVTWHPLPRIRLHEGAWPVEAGRDSMG
jgi:Holliday junction resolvase-like predicted endonuclease